MTVAKVLRPWNVCRTDAAIQLVHPKPHSFGYRPHDPTYLMENPAMNIRTTLLAFAALGVFCAAPAQAQWATLKGKFKTDAAPAPAAELTCNKDPATCCAKKLVDQSLVVSKDLDVANVFVYARSKVAKIDPSLEKDLKPLTLDNKDCVFVPHAAILWNKQKLVLKNSDNVGHNTNYGSATQGFNVLIAAGESVEKSLANGENLPQNVGCNIHPWMTAKLLVRDNPYFAVSAEDGSFTIKNVPVGEEIEYVFWHEKTGYLGGLKFTGGESDAKGRFKLKAAADKDLGTITIPSSKIK